MANIYAKTLSEDYEEIVATLSVNDDAITHSFNPEQQINMMIEQVTKHLAHKITHAEFVGRVHPVEVRLYNFPAASKIYNQTINYKILDRREHDIMFADFKLDDNQPNPKG